MLSAAGLVLACSLAYGETSAQNSQQFSGVASYYTEDCEGAMASGDHYDAKKFTAAHRTLPFGTRLLITDPMTHLSVEVTVNDRGPFTEGRVIDLSLAAATALRMTDRGLVAVTAAVQ
jgi:rare lipoprotein A